MVFSLSFCAQESQGDTKRRLVCIALRAQVKSPNVSLKRGSPHSSAVEAYQSPQRTKFPSILHLRFARSPPCEGTVSGATLALATWWTQMSQSATMLSGEQRHVAGLIAFNLAVNVSIVLVNKYVFDVFGFNYAATLTAVHFWATAAGLRLMAWQKLFTPKPVALLQVLPIATAYALSIPLSNLSLAFNSVGVYQMVRVAEIACPTSSFAAHLACLT